MSTQPGPEHEPQAPNIEALQADNARLTAENEALKAREAAVAELLATAAEQAGELSDTLRRAARMLGATAMSASVENPEPAESEDEDSNVANIREQAAIVAAARSGNAPSATAASAEESQAPEVPQTDEPELSAGEAEIARVREESAIEGLDEEIDAARNGEPDSDDQPEADRTLIIPADDADEADRPVRRLTPRAPVDDRGGRRRAGGERRRRLRRRFAAIGTAVLVAAGVGGAYLAGWFDRDDRAKENGTPPTRPAPLSKHDKMLQRVQNAPTVNRAIQELKTGSDSEFRKFVQESYANRGDYNDMKVSHKDNMYSQLKNFDKHSSSHDIREAAWLSSLNDLEVRAGYWNNINGHKSDAPIPASVTAAEQLKDLYQFFSSDQLKTDNVRLNGTYANGLVFEANGKRAVAHETFKNVRAIQLEVDGKKILIKVGGGNDGNGPVCVNPEDLLKLVVTKEAPQTSTPSNPIGGPSEKPRTPVTTVGPKTTPPKATPPVTSTPATTPAETPPETPDEEKKDDAVLPGDPAVPADQDPGTPDVAGAAPATPGLTPGVPQVPATPPAGQELPANLPPAETGTPTNAPQENVPGTGNAPGQGQGGSTNPDEV